MGKKSNKLDKTRRVTEAVKELRCNLISVLDSKDKVIMITSAESTAGVSFVASSLAISFAQIGYRILIIDANANAPSLHTHFGLVNNYGLLNILLSAEAGFNTEKPRKIMAVRPVIKTGSHEVDVITYGVPEDMTDPPDVCLSPWILNSLLDEIQDYYDMIILDMPSLECSSDVLTIASLVSGTLFVARQNKTRYDMLRKAIEQVERVNGKILGTVINHYSPNKAH